MKDTEHESTHKESKHNKPYLKGALAAVAVLVAVVFAYGGYLYAVSPAAIRNPKIEHAHFRLQLIANEEEVNFGEKKYQQTYEKGICSAELSEAPIHFHDNKDDLVHLHWKEVTGGLVLKNYGWDYIGGPNDSLGYRLDELPKVKNVPIYGDVLPNLSDRAKLWVYTGSTDEYKERAAEEFVNQDLETFFGKKSLINAEEELSFWDKLFPKAYAHAGEAHNEESSDEELQRINNLLGDVVVFAQDSKPTDQQIKNSFKNLEPLSESTCGG